MKRKYKINDNFFDDINSEEKAYLLGFFLADGSLGLGSRCTKSYRFSLSLQSDDVEILDMFKQNIAPDSLIKVKSYQNKWAKNRKPTAFLRWTSSHIGEVFQSKYKICPRKTYDHDFLMNFDYIPKEFIFDFIRGYFDGDGAVSYNYDTHALQFAIYGTSVNFLNQIADFYEKEFNVERRISYKDNKTTRLYCLMFNAFTKKKDFHNLMFEKFYKGKKYYLKRKMLKFLGYLKFKYRDNPEDCERLQDIVEHRE